MKWKKQSRRAQLLDEWSNTTVTNPLYTTGTLLEVARVLPRVKKAKSAGV